ncbi:hypothetical protein GGF32_009467 [Allomyces javanicus]|nr:hypothetical protein GGF32_009467 [Allomyces javanicus]
MWRYTAAAVIEAAARDDVSFCQWWLRRTAPYSRSEASCAMAVAIDTAAKLGHVAIIDWWMSHAYPVANVTSRFVRVASAHGQINLLEWAARAGLPIQRSTDAMDAASANGHIDVLEWWCDVHARGIIRKLPFLAPMTKASANGHVDVLDWWWRRFGCVPSSKDRDYAVVVTSRNAQLDALDWWLADKKRRNGAVDAMRWWIAHKLPFAHSPAAIDCACQAGHMAVLDWWLYESGIEPLYTVAALANASQQGRVEVLEWWERSGLPLKYTEDTRRNGIESETDGIAIWWRSSKLPPSASVEEECL